MTKRNQRTLKKSHLWELNNAVSAACGQGEWTRSLAQHEEQYVFESSLIHSSQMYARLSCGCGQSANLEIAAPRPRLALGQARTARRALASQTGARRWRPD